MGIRFSCPHCQRRLNVKAHQGGKRGVCPGCGGEVSVPLESENAAGSRRWRQGEDLSGEMAERPGDILGTGSGVRTLTTLDTFSVAELDDSGASDDSISLQPTTRAAPDSESFQLGKPENPSLRSGAPDPIESAPRKVWYIRHPVTGERGPLPAREMRALRDAGKIQPGSYLWREDWEDWEKVGAVFPSLAGEGDRIPEKIFRDAHSSLPLAAVGARRLVKPPAHWAAWTVAIVAGSVTIVFLVWLLVYVINLQAMR